MKLLPVFTILSLFLVSCDLLKSEEDPNPEPTASFTFTIDDSNPLTVSFQNTSENTDSYVWDFGDGSSATSINPEYTYLTEGTYNVKLTVTGEGGTDQASRSVTVEGGAVPIADFTYVMNDLEVSFTNTSINAESYNWSFGDGSSSNQENPIKNYPSGGTYTVVLTSTSTGGSDIKTEQISVIPPEVPFSIDAISPADGTINVAIESSIEITFSAEIDHSTLESNVDLQYFFNNSTGSVRTGTWTVNGNKATFEPDDLLSERLSEFRLKIKTGLRDVNGNVPSFASEQISYFTTQAVSENYYYRIYNAKLGTGFSLDTPSGAAPYYTNMAATGNFTGQMWRFQETSQAGKYTMSNKFRGTGFLLEGASPNDDSPAFLTAPPSGGGLFTGQVWYFEAEPAGGWTFIRNNGIGSGFRLDQRNVDVKTDSGTTDQFWSLIRLEKIN
ncbi:MAG: PKD domain-containing protein [Cyclobacteriaceae bacterium]